MKRSILAIAIVALFTLPTAQAADGPTQPATVADATATIPPGTTITTANWSQYKSFMPEGMIALFTGRYSWKMPDDVSMEIGPTLIHPLPKTYLEATEKYANQVKLVELPDGGLSLANYHGGIPFPNPADPHKGWKTLANLWYRYIPHLVVDTYGSGCGIDGGGNFNCQAYVAVKRQLSYNTDVNAPVEAAGPDARYFTEWFMTVEPEQDKYTAYLTVNYADPAKPEDSFVFLPALRRYQPIATSARCSESQGLDQTFEDFHNGLDTDLTQMEAEYVGHRQIIALVDAKPPSAPFPAEVAMPLGFPTPSWGNWQLRDVDVLALKKIPSKAAGYCYGKRVIYADSHFAYPLWEELYDMDLKPSKIGGLYPLKVDVPGVGPISSGALDIETFWDLQHKHATFASEPVLGRPYYINEQAPKEYNDDSRYTTPAGLNLIMR
jgi:hypothetical protein